MPEDISIAELKEMCEAQQQSISQLSDTISQLQHQLDDITRILDMHNKIFMATISRNSKAK